MTVDSQLPTAHPQPQTIHPAALVALAIEQRQEKLHESGHVSDFCHVDNFGATATVFGARDTTLFLSRGMALQWHGLPTAERGLQIEAHCERIPHVVHCIASAGGKGQLLENFAPHYDICVLGVATNKLPHDIPQFHVVPLASNSLLIDIPLQ